MSVQFTVLASGSSGNCSLLETPRGGVLLDCGLPPREIATRLNMIGATWSSISAVIITHTHTDHWNKYTLQHLRRAGIPLYAHPLHQAALANVSSFTPLHEAGLVKDYLPTERFEPIPGLMCLPVPVPHDSDPTFALRLDATPDHQGKIWSLALASDLGNISPEFLLAMAGVDVLAIEFNHDVRLERSSRRPRFLIERVLGDYGHLSNRQAGEAVEAIAKAMAPEHLQAVFQLHLSRDCNAVDLAVKAGMDALTAAKSKARLITAMQDRPTATVRIAPRAPRSVRVPNSPRRVVQPVLPGMEE